MRGSRLMRPFLRHFATSAATLLSIPLFEKNSDLTLKPDAFIHTGKTLKFSHCLPLSKICSVDATFHHNAGLKM